MLKNSVWPLSSVPPPGLGLLANTLWLLGLDHLQWQWLIVLNTVLHWVLVAVGTVTMLSIIAVMAYGFANNRRLVGKLAVDALPGS